MNIPDQNAFLVPFLRSLSTGEAKTRAQLIADLLKHFGLPQSAMQELSGNQRTIVECKDETAHGDYRTKRVILEMVDQMSALPTMAVPAPKDEDSTYDVPDVGCGAVGDVAESGACES